MLPKFNKILYCTDFSESAVTAFKYVVSLAKETGAEIHVLHVVENLSSEAKIALQSCLIDSESRYKMLKQRVKFAEEILQKRQDDFWGNVSTEDKALRSQIKSSIVIESYPVEAILKVSKNIGVDIIVMGTHERGVLHTFLGSIAKNVLKQTTTPVLIVPVTKDNLTTIY